MWKKRKKESEVTQSYPTLWDCMDCSLPESSIHGIFQARVLEWVAISFSRGSSFSRDQPWGSWIAGGCLLFQLLWKHQTADWLETKGWLCWLLINSPTMNQKNVYKLIMKPTTPFPHLIFKTFSPQSSGNSRMLSPGCMDNLLRTLW